MTKVWVPGVHDAPISQLGRPRPMRGITKALRFLLQDGNYHSIDEIIEKLLYYLPAEYAEVVYYQRGRSTETSRSRDEIIYAGRRDIISNMVSGKFNTQKRMAGPGNKETFYRLVSKTSICQACHQSFVHEGKKNPPRCPRCFNLQQMDNLKSSPLRRGS